MLRFINNFSTTLAQPLAASGANKNDMFIPPADAARLAALLDNTTYTHQLMLTLFDAAGAIEIVVIDEAHGNTGQLFAYRGFEGTTARDWPGGTTVAARLTARALAALPLLAVAMQLTDASGVLQDASGEILTTPDLPTFFGGADPYGLADQPLLLQPAP